MPVNNLRNLHRDGANFIFRNERLFIGWHVWDDHRTEAWLGVLNNDAAGREGAQTTTDWLRIYTSSDGPEKLTNDVMGINLLHPALIERHAQGSDQAFLDLGRGDRLRYLETRHNHVMNGRYKCCEYEGGMLHVMAPPPALAPVKKKVQKRRRDSSESEEEEEACRAADGKKRRSTYDCYDDGGDDDEEMPPQLIKEEPKDDEQTSPEPSQPQARDQLSPGIANLGLQGEVDEVDPVEEGQEHPLPQVQQQQHVNATGTSSLDESAQEHPLSEDPQEQQVTVARSSSLAASAQELQKTLINRIMHWDKPTGLHRADFGTHAGNLVMASEAAEILSAAQGVLRSMSELCDKYARTIAAQHQILKDMEADGMPMKGIEAQKASIGRNENVERDLRAQISKLKERAEWLKSELTKESQQMM